MWCLQQKQISKHWVATVSMEVTVVSAGPTKLYTTTSFTRCINAGLHLFRAFRNQFHSTLVCDFSTTEHHSPTSHTKHHFKALRITLVYLHLGASQDGSACWQTWTQADPAALQGYPWLRRGYTDMNKAILFALWQTPADDVSWQVGL